jgi:hypothetical protein
MCRCTATLSARHIPAPGPEKVPGTNGASENEGVVGRNKIYWTAMASLVLEVYLHYLPAYQRSFTESMLLLAP